MGFENFTKLVQTVSPLTQYKLMEKKLSIIWKNVILNTLTTVSLKFLKMQNKLLFRTLGTTEEMVNIILQLPTFWVLTQKVNILKNG
jgi:hypothetical protein